MLPWLLLAAAEPEAVDHWIVARRGPSGFGIVATPDNIVTALKGQAAADGLLQRGDLVVECDGERLSESLSAVVKRSGREEHTLGVRRFVLKNAGPPPSLGQTTGHGNYLPYPGDKGSPDGLKQDSGVGSTASAAGRVAALKASNPTLAKELLR